MKKFRDTITGLIFVLIGSSIFCSTTLIQTFVGASTTIIVLIVCYVSIKAGIESKSHILDEKKRVHIIYALVASIILFNAAIHTSYISTLGQTLGQEFIGETDTPITLNGHHYRLLWTKRSWHADLDTYNLYERGFIFYHRVNKEVITYVNDGNYNHDAVWLFKQKYGNNVSNYPNTGYNK